LALVPAFAWAQDQTDAKVEDLIVTGSRLIRDGIHAPTPTTVVSAEQLRLTAQASVLDIVNQQPQLSGSVTPRARSNLSAGDGAGANYLNLRGLGVARTLVLLDGRRGPPSTSGGSVGSIS
jgi:iron complex outermembrane receptor protein